MSGFLNKVAGGLNKGVATVSANTKAMADKSKVKAVIANLENERKQLTQLLGQKIYDMHMQTGEISVDESISSFIAEITRRQELVKEQNEEIARIEAEVNMVTGGTRGAAPAGSVACACGHLNSAGFKFCAGCGTPSA
jgi:hypothetical protein